MTLYVDDDISALPHQPQRQIKVASKLVNREDARCLSCNKPFVFGLKKGKDVNIYSLLGAKEVAISGLCEICFDGLFDGEEE